MAYHLRFTPYDISGYSFDFLDKYKAYIVAHEGGDVEDINCKRREYETESHYHIYIEDDNVSDQTIRLALKAGLKIPSTGTGKGNKYYAFIKNWKDPGYICKSNEIIRSKGFTEKQILDFVVSGRKKYQTKVDGTELRGEAAPADRPKRNDRATNADLIGESLIRYSALIRELKEKNEYDGDHRRELVKIICEVLRENGRGINPFQVREFAYAVLFETDESKNYVLDKIFYML